MAARSKSYKKKARKRPGGTPYPKAQTGIKERISQTVAPGQLTGATPSYILDNYIYPFIKGETNEGNVLTKESIPKIYGEGNIDPQIDMFRKYLDLPQYYNTMVPSEHRTERIQGDAYDFNPAYKAKIIKDLKSAYGSFEGTVKAHDLTDVEKTVFDQKTISFQDAEKLGQPYTGEATTLFPLSRHQESVQYDPERDEQYIDYRDIFDFDPELTKGTGINTLVNKLNNPYNIYGRLYEGDFDPTKVKTSSERRAHRNIPKTRYGGTIPKYPVGGSVSPGKAKEILRHGSVRGHKLTDKQKKFFGAMAGGNPKYPGGGRFSGRNRIDPPVQQYDDRIGYTRDPALHPYATPVNRDIIDERGRKFRMEYEDYLNWKRDYRNPEDIKYYEENVLQYPSAISAEYGGFIPKYAPGGSYENEDKLSKSGTRAERKAQEHADFEKTYDEEVKNLETFINTSPFYQENKEQMIENLHRIFEIRYKNRPGRSYYGWVNPEKETMFINKARGARDELKSTIQEELFHKAHLETEPDSVIDKASKTNLAHIQDIQDSLRQGKSPLVNTQYSLKQYPGYMANKEEQVAKNYATRQFLKDYGFNPNDSIPINAIDTLRKYYDTAPSSVKDWHDAYGFGDYLNKFYDGGFIPKYPHGGAHGYEWSPPTSPETYVPNITFPITGPQYGSDVASDIRDPYDISQTGGGAPPIPGVDRQGEMIGPIGNRVANPDAGGIEQSNIIEGAILAGALPAATSLLSLKGIGNILANPFEGLVGKGVAKKGINLVKANKPTRTLSTELPHDIGLPHDLKYRADKLRQSKSSGSPLPPQEVSKYKDPADFFLTDRAKENFDEFIIGSEEINLARRILKIPDITQKDRRKALDMLRRGKRSMGQVEREGFKHIDPFDDFLLDDFLRGQNEKLGYKYGGQIPKYPLGGLTGKEGEEGEKVVEKVSPSEDYASFTVPPPAPSTDDSLRLYENWMWAKEKAGELGYSQIGVELPFDWKNVEEAEKVWKGDPGAEVAIATPTEQPTLKKGRKGKFHDLSIKTRDEMPFSIIGDEFTKYPEPGVPGTVNPDLYSIGRTKKDIDPTGTVSFRNINLGGTMPEGSSQPGAKRGDITTLWKYPPVKSLGKDYTYTPTEFGTSTGTSKSTVTGTSTGTGASSFPYWTAAGQPSETFTGLPAPMSLYTSKKPWHDTDTTDSPSLPFSTFDPSGKVIKKYSSTPTLTESIPTHTTSIPGRQEGGEVSPRKDRQRVSHTGRRFTYPSIRRS